MIQRLRGTDASLLATEAASTPMHNATVEIFDPGESGFDYDRLLALIGDRIAFVPRYRMRLQQVPGRLAAPLWVDDPYFDLGYHVRRSALPAPGDLDQLCALVGRISSRRLDRHRPLWEVYLVEGLDGGRVAILSKSHQILVDGVETVDLGQVLLDVSPEPADLATDPWEPQRRRSAVGLVADAMRDNLVDPVGVARRVAPAVGAMLPGVRRPALESPVNAPLSEQRRVLMLRTDLDDYRKVRRFHGGSVNDVILATITGALREWLMTRGGALTRQRSLRAMVPMSVIDDELEPTSLGTQITGHLVDLPIGEASPVVRLHQVSYAFKAHRETGRAVAANRLSGIAGFAPTTFHALGSRVAFDQTRKGFNLTVTNVPGPQFPLYASGAKMVETYPVPPLLTDHTLAIGVTSYDGGVYYGITADRDALRDVDVFQQCLVEALEELVESASTGRQRAPRGRRKSTTKSGRPDAGENGSD